MGFRAFLLKMIHFDVPTTHDAILAKKKVYRLPSLLIAKAPTNGWLEYYRFLLGLGLFSGANC